MDTRFKGSAITTEYFDLTDEWDKTFPKNKNVSHHKVTFPNRYGITLAADLYMSKETEPGKKLQAVPVSGPFGGVKEQASGLYAQKLAEEGFLTIAFDPSFTGESGGRPRYAASPDLIPKTSRPRWIFWRPARKSTARPSASGHLRL